MEFKVADAYVSLVGAGTSAGAQRDTPAPTDVRALIAYLAHRRIRGFCGTIDESGKYLSNVYKENRSLSAHVTADYHGRFLIELIQNGNDIHLRDRRDGEIEVLLDEAEGPHGTFYVANRGGGFTAANVNALCDIGMSSKPLGEAIGNKGLGFRSVLHVTDKPSTAICTAVSSRLQTEKRSTPVSS